MKDMKLLFNILISLTICLFGNHLVAASPSVAAIPIGNDSNKTQNVTVMSSFVTMAQQVASTATTPPPTSAKRSATLTIMEWCRLLEKHANICDRSFSTRKYLVKCGRFKISAIGRRCNICREGLGHCDSSSTLFRI